MYLQSTANSKSSFFPRLNHTQKINRCLNVFISAHTYWDHQCVNHNAMKLNVVSTISNQSFLLVDTNQDFLLAISNKGFEVDCTKRAISAIRNQCL